MKQMYTKFNLALLFIVLFSFGAFAQQSNLWTKTSEVKVSTLEQVFRKSEPKEFALYQLDFEALKSILQNAPQRGELNVISNVVVDFPSVDGHLEPFRIMEASVMHPTLQAQFPELRSYVGQSIQNPSNILRFSVTPQGLHTMLLASELGTQYIDPYTKSGNFYIVYAKQNLLPLDASYICEFIDEQDALGKSLDFDAERNANDGFLRRYDLALGCSANYTNFHGGTVPQALAAMVVSITRVTGVFERDLSIRLSLVANNSSLISTNSNQIFGNTTATINTATATISGIIGVNNYDIGHVFTTGAGGLAGLGVVCIANQKGRGITGINAPTGDAFDIDFVAHEIGHQFGAEHTFNGSTGNCAGGNRSPNSAYEPGSGTTIMAYAGICSPQNVQNFSDDYFHRRSIVQIWNNISAGAASSCPTNTPIGNAAPTAEAGSSYNIPLLTPYKLTGTSTDANGTASHTYTWEQYDLGPAGVPTIVTATGPMVRSFKGTTNPVRYIPRLQDVLVNGGTSTTWEVLAAVPRVHNFELTVRDNTSNGGQTASDNMTVTTVAGTGPFSVTSQSNNVTWQTGSTQTVTWNVANTTAAPINAANVNILLSTNGGATFPNVIASNVPNTGSYSFTVPSGLTTNQARIIVEGAGNIFYNVNSSNFTIINSEFVMNFASNNVTVCQPNNAVYNFTYNTFSGFSETTTFSATGVPAGASVAFSPPTATSNGTAVTMTVSNTGAATPGTYTITVVGTAASTTKTTNVTLNLYSATLSAATLSSPSNGASNVSTTPTLTWNFNSNAQNYLVQVATDPGFSNIVNSATVTTTSFVASVSPNTQYYWRVIASNQCVTAAPSTVFNFTTANITCGSYTATDTPIAISAIGGGLSYTSTINIPESHPINDLNVKINISHTYVNDLDVSLTSPTGTVVVLSLNNGANGAQNYTNTVFDQEATTPITSGSAPFTGSFIPEGNLSLLNGQMSGGNWTLTVVDDFNQDGGTINEFTIDMCVEGTLGIEENNLSEFIIFPNPNKGEFTIKLNSTSNSNIKVDIFDIRGRKIFADSYSNISQFNQTISLNDVQAGMYLVKVTDGDRHSTKKIIIE